MTRGSHFTADLRRWVLLAGALALLAVLAARPVPSAFAQGGETSLAGRKDLLFTETFETVDWFKKWGLKEVPQNLQLVAEKSADGKPNGVAKILFKKGDNWGSGWSWNVEAPVDEAYLLR